MIRHLFLFAAAPGRQEEAEQSLGTWMAAAADFAQFRGGAVARARAGEFGDLQPPIVVSYDVDSREEGRALKAAMAAIPNPMAIDIPGVEPPDQGAILFADNDHDHGHDHADGRDHDHATGGHQHDEPAHEHLHVSEDALSEIEFNRGGGLLCRLMHAHLQVIAQVAPAQREAGAEIS